MSHIKVMVEDILRNLGEMREKAPLKSLAWQKVNWMFQTISHLSFSVNALDELGAEYRTLYSLPNEQWQESQDFAYKNYRAIVFHTRSLYESTFVYCAGLRSDDLALLSDSEFFDGHYAEVVYACKLRHLFIVHSTPISRTFRDGVGVTALSEEEIFLSKLSSNDMFSEQTRRDYFQSTKSHADMIQKRDNILASIRQKIIDSRSWKNLRQSLTEEEFELMQMLGTPSLNQQQYGEELKLLHELAIARAAE